MASFKIEIPNLKRLQDRLIIKEDLYWAPLKEALAELGTLGAADARAVASGFARSGAMSASIGHHVNDAPAPLWVVVRATAVNKSGRSYPALLEFGAKYGHKHWLRGAVRRAQSQAAALLSAAAAKIEANWGR
jgi:hypothetical protein